MNGDFFDRPIIIFICIIGIIIVLFCCVARSSPYNGLPFCPLHHFYRNDTFKWFATDDFELEIGNPMKPQMYPTIDIANYAINPFDNNKAKEIKESNQIIDRDTRMDKGNF